MSNKEKKPTSSAAEIMRRRYIKGDKKRLKYIAQERKRVEIAQKIYELRAQANLTQTELANLINTRQSVISRLEDADYRSYNMRTLEKIAEAVDYHLTLKFEPNRGGNVATSAGHALA